MQCFIALFAFCPYQRS